MGKASNKVCISQDIKNTPPDNIVVNVWVGLKVIPLRFGTFFGACFKCNGFDHFARNCPSSAKAGVKPSDVAGTRALDSMMEGEAIKIDKASPLENEATPPPDKIVEKPSIAQVVASVRAVEDVLKTSEDPPKFKFSTAIPQKPTTPIFLKNVLSSSPFHQVDNILQTIARQKSNLKENPPDASKNMINLVRTSLLSWGKQTKMT